MNNPAIALDAMLETEKKCGELTVRPITAARYALLEVLESPFVNPDSVFTMANVLPSVYVCTAETDELRGFNSRSREALEAKAMQWADDVDVSKIGPAVDDIARRFKDLFKVAPGTGGADDGKKKLETTTTTAS